MSFSAFPRLSSVTNRRLRLQMVRVVVLCLQLNRVPGRRQGHPGHRQLPHHHCRLGGLQLLLQRQLRQLGCRHVSFLSARCFYPSYFLPHDACATHMHSAVYDIYFIYLFKTQWQRMTSTTNMLQHWNTKLLSILAHKKITIVIDLSQKVYAWKNVRV